MKQISILGCGWLGLPLAKALLKLGFEVKGSTTTHSKLSVLHSAGITGFIIELNETECKGNLQEFLEGSEYLLICIPPGLRKTPNSNFIAKLKQVVKGLAHTDIKKLLYVSSTGVFKDQEHFPEYKEDYKFSEVEIQNSQLVQAEELLLNLPSVTTSVVRFSGLVGEDRHPVRFLSGRQSIKNPEAPVNLIHLENCVKLLSEVMKQNKFGMVFHGNEDIHLSKKAYYHHKAKALSIPLPEFDSTKKSKGKYINMDWTSQTLGLRLQTKI